MKKLLMAWLLVAAVSGFAGMAQAAGTCAKSSLQTAVLNGTGAEVTMVRADCTADAADGSFPPLELTSVGGYLLAVYVDYGTTAPTSGVYDLTANADSMGDADLLGGAGVNLITTAPGWLAPKLGVVYGPAPFYGNVTINQAGNVVNSAVTTIYLLFSRK